MMHSPCQMLLHPHDKEMFTLIATNFENLLFVFVFLTIMSKIQRLKKC